MATYDERVFELVKKYNYQPNLFSDEQVDEIQQLAEQFEIPFNRKTGDFSLRRTIQQVYNGFLEGFTTVPIGDITGDKPKTTYEAIAHSLGHLGGFAPGIIAAPLKFAATGLGKVGLKTGEKFMLEGAQIAGKANHWSIPMIGGDYAKKASDWGLNKAKITSLDAFKKGASPRAFLDQAIHLGAASSVSSIWKGPDEMINSGIHGAIAGGAFAGLGEFRAIGNYLKSKNPRDYRKGEQMAKSAVGATMLGLPTYLQDEPIEMIIYQTLLGGFFGYQSRPAVEAEGGKFIQNLQYSGTKEHIFRPSTHPDFKDYSKGARDYIRKESTENAKGWLNRFFDLYGYEKDYVSSAVEESVRRNQNIPQGERPTQEQINQGYRIKANELYHKNVGDVAEFYVHKDLADIILSHEQKMDANDPVETNKPSEKLAEAKKREKDREVLVIVQEANGEISIIDGIDANKLGFKGSFDKYNVVEKAVDKPAEKLENTEYLTFDGVFIREGKNMLKYKPLETMYKAGDSIDMGGGRTSFNPRPHLEKKLNESSRLKLELKLDENGFYVYGGVKDKGVLTVRRYHDNIKNYTTEQLFRALSRDENVYSYENIKKDYENSWNEFQKIYSHYNDINVLKELHDKGWKSNILAEADRNGLSFEQIHRLMGDGYSKSVVDWNKREQIYMDKSMPLEKGTLGGNIPFAIFNDVKTETFKNEKGETEFRDSDHDGTVYFLEKDMDLMLTKLGLDPNASMIKPVIVAKIPGYGTMIVKSAGRSASKPIEAYMKDKGLRALIMKSAAKHTGDLNVNNFDIEVLKKGEYSNTGELFKYDMNETDIRINLGTYEKGSSAIKSQKIARQLSTHLPDHIMKVMWDKVYLESIKGKEESNKLVNEYIINNDMSKVKSINVNDVSTELVHAIFSKHGNTELARKFAREILNMEKSGDLMDIDTFTDAEYQQWIYKNNRILDLSDVAQSQREAGHYARKFFETSYKKYMINRYYSPKYKYSSKGWLAPKDPHLQFDTNIKEGTFMLDLGMGKMKVNYQGKDMTLKEAWKKAKGNNKDKAFEFLVIRVPSDSASGTRLLRFNGFTKQRGYSVLTNAKDNAYLGGADKDSDSVFIYQNMPKEVKDYVKSKKNQWETSDGRSIDGKSELYDSLFGVEKDEMFFTKGSKFSPSLRRRVAETAQQGQQQLGFGINAKTNLTAFANYMINNQLNIIKTPLISKKGNKYGEIVVKLKPDTLEKLNKLGREIVNRSADASNYAKMREYAQIRDMLVQEAFDGYVYNNFTKKKRKLSYTDIKNNTVLKDIDRAIESMNPKSRSIDTWSKLQDSISTINVSKQGNLASLAASKMQKDNIGTELFDMNLVSKYADILLRAKQGHLKLQQANPIVKVLSQMTRFDTQFNPQNILNEVKKGNISFARELLERDFLALASWNSLNKKGLEIFKALQSMKDKDGNRIFTDKTLLSTLESKILGRIAKDATAIKMKLNNKINKGSEEGNLNKSSNEQFDIDVKSYKRIVLDKMVSDYIKKFGIENAIQPELLHDYFDLWLLSPFKYNQKDTFHGKVPWQSREIGKYTERIIGKDTFVSRGNSIKFLLGEQEALYQSVSKIEKTGTTDPVLFDIRKMDDYSFEPPAFVEYKKRIKIDDKNFIRTRALTESQYKSVLEFEDNLNNNRFIKDNLRDFYENFTEIYGKDQIRNDFNLIDIEDIVAINRFIKDMDVRTKSLETKLPDFAWRASPEYIDTFMRNFEENVFIKTWGKVRTGKDNYAIREIKKYTSTMGSLKDYMNKVVMTIDRKTGEVSIYNSRRYKHKNLAVNDAELINKLVVLKREGKDYKSLNEYKDNVNKKYKIDNKEYTLDQLIADVDKTYTRDFDQFGRKVIYSMNDKKTEYIDFKEIDVNKKYGKYSRFLIWGKNGRFNIENAVKRLIKAVEKGKELPEITLEDIYRINYENDLEFHIGNNTKLRKSKSKLNDKQFREWYRKKIPFQSIAKYHDKNGKPSGYFPHVDFGRNKKTRKEMNDWIKNDLKEFYNEQILNGKSEKEAKRLTKLRELNHQLHKSRNDSDDLGGASDAIASATVDLNNMDLNSLKITSSRNKSTLERKVDMPGFNDTHLAIDIYKEGMFRSLYRSIAAFQANTKIRQFENRKDFGKHTKDWSLYLRMYFRDAMGLPSTFTEAHLNELINIDKNTSKLFGINIEPGLRKLFGPKFKRRGVYMFSDEVTIAAFSKLQQQFKKHGREVPFMKDIPELPSESLRKTDPQLFEAQKNAHMEAMTRLVHKMGRAEAKFQLLTLLAHPKLMVGNMFGGTALTITKGGMKNFLRANNNKWLNANIVKDFKGNYRLKFDDGRFVKDHKDLNEWIAERGVIDSFIKNELNINADLNNVKGAAKKDLQDFIKDVSKKLIRDPNMSDSTMMDIARKYGVSNIMEGSGAWFMQRSERKLRQDAFLTHAIQYMERFNKSGLELSLNDPAVFEAGIRGVEATQFLYHSSARPAFMRTSLGKVLSRFKLFVFNSVRVRKEMLRKASYYGYKPGTKEFDSFKNDFALNMFVMALGTAFAYSLFDTTLPPPYDWVQETSDWLLGDKKTRDKAFFGQYPYPIAPLNIATPPVARIPMSVFSSLINNDWDRFMDYQAYTMFPFGRMIRSLDKTFDEPYGTLEGRALQQFAGIPLDKVRYRINRNEIIKARKEAVTEELEELEELI